MQILVLATGNAHKVSEIQTVLGTSVQCVPMTFVGTPPLIAETGETFAANARLKAVGIADWIREIRHPDYRSAWVMADDSGLEVTTLAWAPGVLSARFAGLDTDRAGNSPDVENNRKLLRLLREVPDSNRQARFRCALHVEPVDPRWRSHPGIFEGRCDGRILLEPSGTAGFGYDPLFVPDGYDLSFSELGEAIKNRISHRSRALEQFKKWWTHLELGVRSE